MHPSLRVCRQPLIKFLGKRSWPSAPETPHAHPAAPAELKKTFDQFLKRVRDHSAEAKSPSPSSKGAFSEFWLAPERFWKNELEEWEIEAIESGGASLRK